MGAVKDYPPYLDYPKPRKPQTNADRIRAMSDEELALELLVYCPSDSVFKGTCLEGRGRYSAADGQYYKNGSEAVRANLDWLRQPVKDGEGE